MENTYDGVLGALVQSKVEFMVVGGVAVALNGFVRTTEDLDILVSDDPENVKRLLDCLAGFGEGSAGELTVDDFTEEEGAIRIQEDFGIDIFVQMRGRKYADMLPYLNERESAGGNLIPFLNATGLVWLKQDSMREKDRIDVGALRRIQAKGELGVEAPASIDSLREDHQGRAR